jgi:hypothetical protein
LGRHEESAAQEKIIIGRFGVRPKNGMFHNLASLEGRLLYKKVTFWPVLTLGLGASPAVTPVEVLSCRGTNANQLS